MNYKKRDDELIKLNKQAQTKTNNEKLGYSKKSLAALKNGTYDQLTGRDPKYHTSQEQTRQVKELPTLKELKLTKTDRNTTTNAVKGQRRDNNAVKPSTRYENRTAARSAEPSKRDTTFDKDFETFHTYRYEKADMLDDYKEGQEARPYWQKVKEDIMAKNKWSEEQFDEKWEAYNKERNQKDADKEVQTMADLAKEHPLFGTIAQQAYMPQTLIEGAGSMLSNLLPEEYKAQSANDPAFTGTRAREAAKQTVKDEHIKTGIGKGAYDLLTGIADMAEAAAIPVLGTGALGAQTAARTNMEALERGVDPTKAALTGAATGAVSGFMNKVGLDKALGSVGKTAAGTIGKAAAKEGLENVLEDSATLGIDSMINRNRSQLNALHNYYVQQGMSDRDAWQQVAKETTGDLTKSALAGATFGGVAGGVRNFPSLLSALSGRNKINGNMEAPGRAPSLEGNTPAAAEALNTGEALGDMTGRTGGTVPGLSELEETLPKNEERFNLEAQPESRFSDNGQPLGAEANNGISNGQPTGSEGRLPSLWELMGVKEEATPINEAAPEGDAISRRYETLRNSDLFQTSEANMRLLENAKEQGVFNKDIENRAIVQQEALDDFISDPEKARNRNLNRAWDSGKDVDTSMLILQEALNNEDQGYTNLVLLKQAQQAKAAGRELRAFKDYAGTKEATVQKAGQYLNDIADSALSSRKEAESMRTMAESVMNGNRDVLTQRLDMDEDSVKNISEAIGAGASKEDITKMLAMYKAVGKTGISQEALSRVNEIYSLIDDLNLSPTSKQRAELEADAFKVLAQDIGGKQTWRSQWDSWRYLAMLGNTKTHLRNILGNSTHRMVTEAKDNIGALLEAALDKTNRAAGGEGIDRTKSLLGIGDRGLVKAAANDADDISYKALNDMGNKYNVKNEIERARSSFNNKWLSKIDEFNSNLLDKEDYSALKKKYSSALARYLKANGADESIFSADDEASKALLDKARVYAVDQAKQATFHDYSKLAESLTRFSKEQQQGNIANKVIGAAVEGVLPFKKTPINILKQGIKYSPVSLAKSISTMAKAVKTGNKTASDAIEDLASGLTGTGIMALGGFLADQGIVTGGANPDYDVDNAETEQGKQNYALRIGNSSYTLDWLAPVALPFFVGVELNNMLKRMKSDEEGSTIDYFFDALATIAEPITEMSMMQSVQNILNELSYSRENPIATVLTNTALGYLGQAIPTAAGQFARAIDDNRRSTYTDQPQGYKRQFDKALIKNTNKIPFLSMMNEPYINAKGEEAHNEGLASTLLGSNFGTRLLDQTLSPGYFKQGTVTPLDEELNRLYELTGEDLYENVANGKVDQAKLSKEKFTEYQRLYGQNTDSFYNSLFDNKDFQGLDDEQKVEAFKEAKRVSKMIADFEVGEKEIKKGKKEQTADELVYDLYKKNGKDAVGQYLIDYANAKGLDMSYKSYKKQQDEYQGGAEQYAKDAEKADALGLTVKTYNKKQAEYEGGAEKYAQDKKTADDLGIKPESYNKIIERAGNNSDKVLNAVPVLKKNGLANTNAYLTYVKAVNVVPSLTPTEFSRTFNAIDADHNKGIKMDELLTYFNSRNMSEAEVMKMWDMYAPEGKSVPYLKKDGTWGKHSPK